MCCMYAKRHFGKGNYKWVFLEGPSVHSEKVSSLFMNKCKQSTQYVDLVVLDYLDAREEFFISFKNLKDNFTVNWIPSLKFMILAKTPH